MKLIGKNLDMFAIKLRLEINRTDCRMWSDNGDTKLSGKAWLLELWPFW